MPSINHHISRILKGDTTSCAYIYDSYKVSFFKMILLYVRHREDAQDVLQDGFIQIFKKLELYDPAKGKFETWARKVMVNMCLQHLRKHKKWKGIVDLNEAILSVKASYEISGIASMDLQDLYDVIYKLPDGYRLVFNLYVVEGYSHKEIASMLEISENTSKSQLSKAKSKLRKMVNHYLPEYNNYGQAARTYE